MTRRFAALAVFVGLWLSLAPSAHAVVITGESSAYDVRVHLGLTQDSTVDLPLLPPVTTTVTASANVTAGPTASGVAPPPYAVSNSALTASVLLLGPFLSTGVLNASASSNVDQLPGDRFATASASVDNLLVSIPLLLSLSATVVDSTSTVTGDFGSFDAEGSSTVVGVLTILGQQILLDVNASTPPNTVIDVFSLLSIPPNVNITGSITITLNEQIEVCGPISCGIETNAIDIAFNNVDVNIVVSDILSENLRLDGSIIISHSEAFLRGGAAIPEPTTLLLLGSGLAGLGVWRRRRPPKIVA